MTTYSASASASLTGFSEAPGPATQSGVTVAGGVLIKTGSLQKIADKISSFKPTISETSETAARDTFGALMKRDLDIDVDVSDLRVNESKKVLLQIVGSEPAGRLWQGGDPYVYPLLDKVLTEGVSSELWVMYEDHGEDAGDERYVQLWAPVTTRSVTT